MATGKQSIEKQVTRWRNLITNVLAGATETPGLMVHISKLQEVLEGVDALTAELDSRLGLRRKSTQERQQLMAEGQDAASQARLALRAHLGIRNAKLVEYGIPPLEARRKSPTSKEPSPPPTTEAQEPEAKKPEAPETKKPEPETPAPAAPAEPTK